MQTIFFRKPSPLVKLIPIVHSQEIQPSESEMHLESTQRADFNEQVLKDEENTLKVPQNSGKKLFAYGSEPHEKYQPATTSSVRKKVLQLSILL